MSIAKKYPAHNSVISARTNIANIAILSIANTIYDFCPKTTKVSTDRPVPFDLLVIKARSIQKNNPYNIKHLDIYYKTVKLAGRAEIFLFRGLIASNRSGKHLSLTRCCPRRHGRGDDSVYNRLLTELKTIITVFGGSINSPIAKASQGISTFFTFFGDQNIWSFAVTCCFRPYCFNYKGVYNA